MSLGLDSDVIISWLRIIEYDIPDRSIEAYMLSNEGLNKISLKFFSDSLAEEMLQLERKGINTILAKIFRGQISDILDTIEPEHKEEESLSNSSKKGVLHTIMAQQELGYENNRIKTRH